MRLAGKHFLVVGGTKGIGASISKSLAERGARVTITGRTQPAQPLGELSEFVPADLSTVRGAVDLGRKLQGLDIDTVVFTVGIFAKSKLERNSEGVEMDLAVSYLSRFVLVKHFADHQDHFAKLSKVFVWGYPGGDVTPTNVDDLNFETTAYAQWGAHMNTVVLNEALVYETQRRFPHLQVFGVNPGLIETGIRDNVHGGEQASYIGWLMEKAIGLFTPTVDQYVERTVMPKLLENDALASPACYSKAGKLIPSVGWVAVEANRIRAWDASADLVNKVLK